MPARVCEDTSLSITGGIPGIGCRNAGSVRDEGAGLGVAVAVIAVAGALTSRGAACWPWQEVSTQVIAKDPAAILLGRRATSAPGRTTPLGRAVMSVRMRRAACHSPDHHLRSGLRRVAVRQTTTGHAARRWLPR